VIGCAPRHGDIMGRFRRHCHWGAGGQRGALEGGHREEDPSAGMGRDGQGLPLAGCPVVFLTEDRPCLAGGSRSRGEERSGIRILLECGEDDRHTRWRWSSPVRFLHDLRTSRRRHPRTPPRPTSGGGTIAPAFTERAGAGFPSPSSPSAPGPDEHDGDDRERLEAWPEDVEAGGREGRTSRPFPPVFVLARTSAAAPAVDFIRRGAPPPPPPPTVAPACGSHTVGKTPTFSEHGEVFERHHRISGLNCI